MNYVIFAQEHDGIVYNVDDINNCELTTIVRILNAIHFNNEHQTKNGGRITRILELAAKMGCPEIKQSVATPQGDIIPEHDPSRERKILLKEELDVELGKLHENLIAEVPKHPDLEIPEPEEYTVGDGFVTKKSMLKGKEGVEYLLTAIKEFERDVDFFMFPSALESFCEQVLNQEVEFILRKVNSLKRKDGSNPSVETLKKYREFGNEVILLLQ